MTTASSEAEQRAREASRDLRSFLQSRVKLDDDCRTAINQAFLAFAQSEAAPSPDDGVRAAATQAANAKVPVEIGSLEQRLRGLLASIDMPVKQLHDSKGYGRIYQAPEEPHFVTGDLLAEVYGDGENLIVEAVNALPQLLDTIEALAALQPQPPASSPVGGEPARNPCRLPQPPASDAVVDDGPAETIDGVETGNTVAPNNVAPAKGAGADVERLAHEAALRMWSVHPNDLDAKGFISDRHGGDYENPRAAYYAFEIMEVVRTALAAPPQPAGTDDERRKARELVERRAVARIVNVAREVAWQAGVGGRETAGAIVSYLATSPDEIAPFMAGELTPVDFEGDWIRGGCLSWHAASGKVVSPDDPAPTPEASDMGREG